MPTSAQHSGRSTARLLLVSILVWGGVLYGCGSSGSVTSGDGPVDSTAIADTARSDTTTDSLRAARSDTLRADSTRADSLRAGASSDSLGPDSLRPDSLRPDSLQPDADDAPRAARRDTVDRPAFVDADSLSAFVRDGERLQELIGNVFVRQDSTRLRSLQALRSLTRDEFFFTGNVVIFERGDTLYADTVRYDKRAKVGRAFGNVRLTDGQVDLFSTSARYYANEKRSVFPDTVTLVDEDRMLNAESGAYFSADKRAEFYGNVRMTDPETYMEADSVTYYRDDEVSVARGRVFIERLPEGQGGARATDADDRTYLFGAVARNEEARRYSRIEGDAALVQIRTDSTGSPTDTLFLSARQLQAFRVDSLRRMIATRSVRIWQPDLAATADSVVYDRFLAVDSAETSTPPTAPPDSFPRPQIRDLETAWTMPDVFRPESYRPPPLLGGPVRVDPARFRHVRLAATPARPALAGPSTETSPRTAGLDSLRTPGLDSVDATRRDTLAARAASGTSTASGTSDEQDAPPPREETRLFSDPSTWFEDTQVTGDTIRVLVRNRSVDTVFVRSNAFAAQRDSALDKVQQLKGRTITALFQDDSLRTIRAEPNAQAIRFMATKQKKPNGAAKVSGDRIVLRFRNGEVHRVSVLSGIESQYFKQEVLPSPFELDGFTWTPGTRPTRAEFVRDPRIRERLDLPDAPPDRPAPDSLRPDSLTPPIAQTPRPDSVQASAEGGDEAASPAGPGRSLEDRRPGRVDASEIRDSTRTPADTLQGDARRPSASTPPVRRAPASNEDSERR